MEQGGEKKKGRRTLRGRKDLANPAVKSLLLEEELDQGDSQVPNEFADFDSVKRERRTKNHSTKPRESTTSMEDTGVPRADTVGIPEDVSEFQSATAQPRLTQPSKSQQSESLGALVNGIRAMQESLDSQYQLIQQMSEWQERFQSRRLQEWFRSQEELGNSILRRQKRLEESIQMSVQGREKTMVPASEGEISATSEKESERMESKPFQLATLGKGGLSKSNSCTFEDRDDMIILEAEVEGDAIATQKEKRQGPSMKYDLMDSVVAKVKSDRPQPIQVTPKALQQMASHRHEPTSCVERIAEHPYFEYMSACVILSHSLFIGLYVEYTASFNAKGHTAFTIGNLILTLVFLCEVFIKFAAEKTKFITGDEKVWNIFDLSLIILVVLEMSLGIVLAGKDKKKMKTVLKIAEMARTVRILRIFRCLKFSETLQVIIMKIFMSFRTLMWVFLLIFIMQAVVAVCFTQGAVEFLGGIQHDSDVAMTAPQVAVYNHFGSVPKSVKTCFASISGGIMWSEVSEELAYISLLYALIFGVYIVGSVFAVLNIITGIFINDMLRAEKELEEDNKNLKLEKYYQELLVLFSKADGSGNGQVTMDDFLAVAGSGNETMNALLEDLNMTVEEASTLFQLLDEDNRGELDVKEFLAGCMHLMASTTGLDMKVILYEQRRMQHMYTQWMEDTDVMLQSIRNHVKGGGSDFPDHTQMSCMRKHAAPLGMKRKEPKTIAGQIVANSEKKRRESKYLSRESKHPVLSKMHTGDDQITV